MTAEPEPDSEDAARVLALVNSPLWPAILLKIRIVVRRVAKPDDWEGIESETVVTLLSYAHEGRPVRSWPGLAAAVVRSNARERRERDAKFPAANAEAVEALADPGVVSAVGFQLATEEGRRRIKAILDRSSSRRDLGGLVQRWGAVERSLLEDVLAGREVGAGARQRGVPESKIRQLCGRVARKILEWRSCGG